METTPATRWEDAQNGRIKLPSVPFTEEYDLPTVAGGEYVVRF